MKDALLQLRLLKSLPLSLSHCSSVLLMLGSVLVYCETPASASQALGGLHHRPQLSVSRLYSVCAGLAVSAFTTEPSHQPQPLWIFL